MKKVLMIGDGVTPTGFKTVIHNIIQGLPQEEYEVHHLAINYYGDPHEYNWKIYPAALGGDIWGFGRLRELVEKGFDAIFILNDIWVIDKYLIELKKLEKELPPIIIYFPVDSTELSPDWFNNMDMVTYINVYTEFGKREVLKCSPTLKVNVIPHGVDTEKFYKIDLPKREVKKQVFPDREDFLDSFIVLNANRNQPRKRADLTLQGFSLFAENKPENVKLYMHCGIKDVGYDIIRLSYRYKIDTRLIITSTTQGVQRIPETKLNLIYNATDVGLNTSVGEGWGLVSHEHAATGAVQIVPDHSACRELFEGTGLLIPVTMNLLNQDTLTSSGYVKPEDVAYELEKLYKDRVLLRKLSDKCYNKFSGEEYTWKYIVDNYWTPLFKEVTNA